MKVFGGSQFQSIAVFGRPPYFSMSVLVYILSRCSFYGSEFQSVAVFWEDTIFLYVCSGIYPVENTLFMSTFAILHWSVKQFCLPLALLQSGSVPELDIHVS